MERIILAIKTGIGFLVGVVSILTGLFGIVFTILLGLMAIDFITGILAGAFTTGLKSDIGAQGLKKKLYIILLIGAIYMIEIAVMGTHGVITDGISAAYCVIELVSIVENGHKLKVPLPKMLMKFIAIMKNKVDETEENKTDNT